jgi:hypothetical protein
MSTSVTKVLSTHDKQRCTQTQLIVFTKGPGLLDPTFSLTVGTLLIVLNPPQVVFRVLIPGYLDS